jgi:hypothetical protein
VKALRRILSFLRTPLDWMVVMMTPACDRIVREASEHLDGLELTRYQRFYIQIHMICCQVCDDYIQNVRILGRALGRIAGRAASEQTPDSEPAPVGPGLTDSARNRMIEHLKKHGRR